MMKVRVEKAEQGSYNWLQYRFVNMIASLFNALLEDGTQAIGTGTVASSEAMLAGLAFRHNWQKKQKVTGLPYDKPNMVTGANVQVWLFLLT
jgi:glutamate decarboxylase